MNKCFKDNGKVKLVHLICMLVEMHRTGSCGISQTAESNGAGVEEGDGRGRKGGCLTKCSCQNISF